MILVDSREQQFQEINFKNHLMIRNVKKYFESNQIEYEITKLEVGDYMNPLNPKLSIDKKKDLAELCQNLCSSDKTRFWKEVRRSYSDKIKLIVLIEQGGQYQAIKDVSEWSGKYSTVSGKKLMEEMYRVHIAYGIDFIFCDKRSTGRIICELLGVK
jgi:ERCC4-type nuclease